MYTIVNKNIKFGKLTGSKITTKHYLKNYNGKYTFFRRGALSLFDDYASALNVLKSLNIKKGSYHIEPYDDLKWAVIS